jgi:hypothetical protein
MIFRTKKRKEAEQGGSAGAGDGQSGSAAPVAPADGVGSTAEVVAGGRRLMEENDRTPDRERERRILRLRHLAGIRYLNEASDAAGFATPDPTGLPAEPLGPVEVDSLTPEVIRAGIVRDGAVFVRGAVSRDAAEQLAAGIEQTFADRAAGKENSAPADGLYEEFAPEPGFSQLSERNWIETGGGVLAADSPRLAFEMFDAFARSGLTERIAGYLGEPVAVSAEKCTLRKADPSIGGAWHQDGNFMGDVRALNVWLALSRCGDEAPGLDVVPRRVDYLVEAGTEGAALSYVISEEKVEAVAGETGIVRPIFEPGDVLLFDDRFLHQTGSDPSMPNPRYAIESWFFGASGFPADYAPIAA